MDSKNIEKLAKRKWRLINSSPFPVHVLTQAKLLVEAQIFEMENRV